MIDIPGYEDRIATILALATGWNGYNALPINPDCVDRSRPFLRALDELGMSPWLVPISNGGVGIERAGTDDYRLEFEPDGKASFCCDGLNDFALMALLLEVARHIPPIKSVAPINALSKRLFDGMVSVFGE